MKILEAIILGIVQGITEWLPISSSGHLVITQQLFNIEADVFFDVLLHFGSLIVIFLVFYEDISKILLSLVSNKYKQYRKMALFIVIASLPIGLAGYFLREPIKGLFTNIKAVGIALVITGILLYITRYAKQNKKLSIKNSFIMGISQAIALVPGISRSGATISTGLLLGVKRKEAVRFSFLLAIPAIFGALIVESSSIARFELIPSIAGVITTIVVGYLSLVLLLKIIDKGKLYYFSFYCWLLGILILIL